MADPDRCPSCPVRPAVPCPGLRPDYPDACRRQAAGESYRAVLVRHAGAYAGLPLVASCPHRGAVLPWAEQREGCVGCERTECRAGKGKVPGAVTLAECLACVAATKEF